MLLRGNDEWRTLFDHIEMDLGISAWKQRAVRIFDIDFRQERQRTRIKGVGIPDGEP